jgi:hypothetical protein
MALTIDTAAVKETRNDILEQIRGLSFVLSTQYIISHLVKHSVDAAPVHLATRDREDPMELAAHYSKYTIS